MTDNKSSAGLRRRQRSMQAVRYITLATALSAGASWAQSVTVTGDASASPTPNPIPHWDYTHFLELVIGNSGEGELAIENGGTMTSGLYPGHRVILGKLAGSSGAATVSGLGSLWKHLGVIRVGDGGRGELNVVDGGGVSASDIEVGIGGLSILNGGTVSAVDVSAQNENSAIRVSGAGSHLQSSLSVSAGSAQIDEGGQVSGKSGDIGGNGAITVSGPGSRWTVDGYLGIGFGGTGSLLIENGGAVVTTDDSGYIMLGHNRDTGYGNVRVTGQGSVWDLAGKLYIGNTGNASVTVDDGGRIIARGEAWIASDPSSTSNLTVENGGRFSSDRLVVGNYGEGTLNLRNGGELSVRLLDLGWRGFGSSIMNIGSASNDPADAVAAGRLNTEYVSLRDNAVLNFNHTGDELKIDGNVIGSGRLNHISGTTRVRTMYGAFQPLIVSGGNLIIEQVSNLYGKLAILSGASLAVDARHGESSIYATLTGGGNLTKSGDEKLEFWGDGSGFTGDTRVTAGELQVFSELGGKADVSGGRLSLFRNDDYGTAGTVGGSVTASGDGTVAGNGIIKGDLTFNRGGVLEGEQGQRLHVDGALKLDRDSQVNVGLSSAPSPALFKVAADLTLDGTLNVSDQGGFGAGIYRLFDYGGRLFDNGLAIGKTPTGVTADHLAIQTAIYGQVNLASTAGATLSFWDGGDAGKHNNSQVDGGSGVWRADGRNWTDVSGALNGPYQPNPSFAIFQGEAGTVTVDHAVGAIAATGMQFASDGYRIEGDSIDLQGHDGDHRRRSQRRQQAGQA